MAEQEQEVTLTFPPPLPIREALAQKQAQDKAQQSDQDDPMFASPKVPHRNTSQPS
jgi:hypothetical protein